MAGKDTDATLPLETAAESEPGGTAPKSVYIETTIVGYLAAYPPPVVCTPDELMEVPHV